MNKPDSLDESLNQSIKRIDIKNNLALIASAGTGKTYNLALRIIAILISRNDSIAYDSSIILKNRGHVLAVTFTKKSTAEMMERVMDFLFALSKGNWSKEDKYYEVYRIVAAVLGITDEKVLVAKAKRALSDIFYDSSILQIQTIDSFSSGILKRFPFEAGIMPDFTVINSVTETALFNEVFSIIFGELIADDKFATNLKKYIDLNDISPALFDELLQKRCRFVLDKRVELLDLINSSKRLTSKEFNIVFSTLLETLDKLQKDITFFYDRDIDEEYTIKETEALIVKLGEHDEYLANPPKRKSKKYDDINAEKKLKNRDRYSAFWETVSDFYNEIEQTEITLVLLLTAKIIDKLDKIKNERGMLTFTDMTRLTYELLSADNASIDKDYLYFRLDSKVEHILLDEFQDTSTAQWGIFEPLVDESMSGLSQNDKVGSFFCVGDPKQTIYRFRGSESNLLQKILKNYSDKIQQHDLDVNYRSDKAIVSFVNDLFDASDKKEPLIHNIPFKMPIQKANSEAEGYVKILKLMDEEGKNVKQQKEEKIVEIINQLINSYNWDYSDIAILVRTNNNAVELHNLLNDNNIPSVTELTVPITQTAVFKVISALSYYILNRKDDDYNLFRFALIAPPLIDQEMLYDSGSIIAVKKSLDKYLDENIDKSLFEIIMNLPENISFFSRFYHNPDFITIISQMAETAPTVTNPATFIDKLKADMASINSVTEQKKDAVKIMTLHKAKGLEFNIVILYTLSTTNNRRNEFITHEYSDGKYDLKYNFKELDYISKTQKEIILEDKKKNDAEEINGLYVAVTRAKKMLYIMAKQFKTPSKDENAKFNKDRYITEKDGLSTEYGAPFEKPKDDKNNAERNANRSDNIKITPDKAMRDIIYTACYGKNRENESSKTDAIQRFAAQNPNPSEYFIDNLVKLSEYKKIDNFTNSLDLISEPISNRYYGLFLHECIYNLPDFSINHLDYAIEKSWHNFADFLSSDKKLDAKKILTALINNNSWQSIINSGDIYREKAFFAHSTLNIIDFYVVKNDCIELVDFKTGEPDNKRALEYYEQVKRYAQILYKNYKKLVKGYVIYLHEDIVIKEVGI